ncbi:MAG: glycosyltransferase family 39 protein [Planctomycetota bacterium]
MVTLVLCLGLGALLDRALFDVPDAGAPERVGRALMWGLSAAGALSMAVDAVGLPVSRTAVGLAFAALALVLLRPAWQRRSPAAPRGEAPPSGLLRLGESGLLLLAAVSLGQAIFSGLVRPTFQFDSLTRWMFKAKVLAVDQTLFGPISLDPAFAFTHQRYPPLVSHIANLPALVTGVFDDRVAQSVFPWFAVALVLVLHGVLVRHVGRLKAALGAAWVASLPLLSYLPYPPPGSGAASAMADIPLALFVTGAGLALVDALARRRDRAHLEAALLLGFATLTKNEGLPLVIGATMTMLVCARRARVRRALGVAGPALLLFALLWGGPSRGFPALDENYPGQVGLSAVVDGLSRLPLVLAGLVDEVAHFRAWNLTWPLVVALLLCGRVRRPTCAPLLVVTVQLSAYVTAYLITAWTSPAAEVTGEDPVVYLITLTMGRLLMHVVPLLIATSLLVSPPLFRRGGAQAVAPAS